MHINFYFVVYFLIYLVLSVSRVIFNEGGGILGSTNSAVLLWDVGEQAGEGESER